MLSRASPTVPVTDDLVMHCEYPTQTEEDLKESLKRSYTPRYPS
jgi:hypothetical protein